MGAIGGLLGDSVLQEKQPAPERIIAMDFSWSFESQSASLQAGWPVIEPIKQAPGSPTVGVWSPYAKAKASAMQPVRLMGKACAYLPANIHPDTFDSGDNTWTIKAAKSRAVESLGNSAHLSLSPSCLPLNIGATTNKVTQTSVSIRSGTITSSSSSRTMSTSSSRSSGTSLTFAASQDSSLLLNDFTWSCLKKGTSSLPEAPIKEDRDSNGLDSPAYLLDKPGLTPLALSMCEGSQEQTCLGVSMQLSSYQLVHNTGLHAVKGMGGSNEHLLLKNTAPHGAEGSSWGTSAAVLSQALWQGSVVGKQDKDASPLKCAFDMELPAGFIECEV